MDRIYPVSLVLGLVLVVAIGLVWRPEDGATQTDPKPKASAIVASSEIPPAPDGEALAARAKALRARLKGKGFTVLVQSPFVVIGDESQKTVKRRSQKTVKWATDRLKEQYFPKDPAAIIDIWLFSGDESYRTNAKELFGDEPGTPFGYFSEEHHALIMNISTGGGTLVHEIVHPFMDANFPQCPSWFNEGMGSLYEQCGEEKGQIVGFTNWRLAGLQEAIKAGGVPPFETLFSTTTDEFYNEDPGTNYAQSRYLCYYLQQHGLLVKFYRQFVANADKDPTGIKTLKKLLGEDDLDAFQDKWEKWVLKLSFP